MTTPLHDDDSQFLSMQQALVHFYDAPLHDDDSQLLTMAEASLACDMMLASTLACGEKIFDFDLCLAIARARLLEKQKSAAAACAKSTSCSRIKDLLP